MFARARRAWKAFFSEERIVGSWVRRVWRVRVCGGGGVGEEEEESWCCCCCCCCCFDLVLFGLCFGISFRGRSRPTPDSGEEVGFVAAAVASILRFPSFPPLTPARTSGRLTLLACEYTSFEFKLKPEVAVAVVAVVAALVVASISRSFSFSSCESNCGVPPPDSGEALYFFIGPIAAAIAGAAGGAGGAGGASLPAKYA